MSDVMNYMGYTGSVEFSAEDNVLYGKVLGIKSLVSYEGTSVDDLLQDFHNAVDSYLDLCKRNGFEPEQPYKGSFNVRISPELHKSAALCARKNKMSLNAFVERSIEAAVANA
ncbi:MAG: type II toxin-antitoxin system HicB family antitoxin [Firmicutes bacterium]|nr:type II toxin-antitoxin system HicB family antitoxin [Bacillota bacterium]